MKVPATPGWLVVASLTALIMGVDTVLVQAGAMPVHAGSPPPLTVAVLLLGLTAVAATVTGTVMTMLPIAEPAAIEQPVKLVAPGPGQPLKVPPVIPIAPLVVIPVGKLSATLIAAVVALLATDMVIV